MIFNTEKKISTPPIPSLSACRNLKFLIIQLALRLFLLLVKVTQTKNKMKGCNFNQIGAIRESMIARIIPISTSQNFTNSLRRNFTHAIQIRTDMLMHF